MGRFGGKLVSERSVYRKVLIILQTVVPGVTSLGKTAKTITNLNSLITSNTSVNDLTNVNASSR